MPDRFMKHSNHILEVAIAGGFGAGMTLAEISDLLGAISAGGSILYIGLRFIKDYIIKPIKKINSDEEE